MTKLGPVPLPKISDFFWSSKITLFNICYGVFNRTKPTETTVDIQFASQRPEACIPFIREDQQDLGDNTSTRYLGNHRPGSIPSSVDQSGAF